MPKRAAENVSALIREVCSTLPTLSSLLCENIPNCERYRRESRRVLQTPGLQGFRVTEMRHIACIGRKRHAAVTWLEICEDGAARAGCFIFDVPAGQPSERTTGNCFESRGNALRTKCARRHTCENGRNRPSLLAMAEVAKRVDVGKRGRRRGEISERKQVSEMTLSMRFSGTPSATLAPSIRDLS
ncbi:hypothetical protein PCA31118_02961 [Pandoraea captiosa]|uniref:Uncharacterized protein n=1 Tax=Pandoraea captiosa TaxID=2508302 RepID=A0A5E5A941_9BURK|nr:hypothetical protein PCA31118_02961 [Pandoraea captiosa]